MQSLLALSILRKVGTIPSYLSQSRLYSSCSEINQVWAVIYKLFLESILKLQLIVGSDTIDAAFYKTSIAQSSFPKHLRVAPLLMQKSTLFGFSWIAYANNLLAASYCLAMKQEHAATSKANAIFSFGMLPLFSSMVLQAFSQFLPIKYYFACSIIRSMSLLIITPEDCFQIIWYIIRSAYSKYIMNRKFLQIYFILILSVLSLTCAYAAAPSQINPALCLNYYSVANPPYACNSSNSCYLELGFTSLMDNNTGGYPFSLCLDLPGYNIYVNQLNSNQSFFEDIPSIYVYAGVISMMNDYSLICSQNLVLIAQNQVQLIDTTLTGSKIWILSQQNIIVQNSNFANESVIPSQCSCVSQSKQCLWTFQYPQLFDQQNNFNLSVYEQQLDYTFAANNSLTFIAFNSINMNGSYAKYSVIGMFAQTISINGSTISSAGLGYPSDSGPGCGYFDEVLNQLLGCMGSGGSYGGFGGNSSPQNCYLLVSREPYGNVSYPKDPGSGGGFFLPHSRESSSGGGIINMQALTLFLNYSIIMADGKNGIQGGGGGAGGTISFDYNQTYGQLTNISANGGNGDKQSSSGSGGRVRLWNHNWEHQTYVPQQNKTFNLTVLGGAGCMQGLQAVLSCGENGSVFTSPCKPGYQLTFPSYICTPCNPGFYQMTFGYSFCIPCTAKPENSNWTQNTSDNQPVYYFNACSFVCDTDAGYSLYESGKCLTYTGYLFEKYYITNVLISLSMIGVAILIYVLIRLLRRLAQQERILSFDDPTLNESYRKKFFRLEDLPYHQLKLYCSGQNHPFNPWRITQEAENSLYAQMKHPITKINHIITRIIKEINTKAQYSRWQKIILLAFRYTYYPCSRLILSSMRKKKAQVIFEEVDKYNKKIPDFQALGIKFNVKPQQTVASLQIFNYTKSVLDFYIQNYFPLFFMLEKAPFGGYIIDFSDPFLKVFMNELMQKQVAGKSIQIFFKDVNIYLKNPATLIACINYLFTLSDINSKFQAFLWQPPNKLLGIEREYKIDKKQPLFLTISSENLNNGHFLLNQSLPSTYLPQIECLKHKFIIRKDLATQQDGNTIWIINNQISEKVLLWVFGFLTSVFLLMTVAIFFLIILMDRIQNDDCKQTWGQYKYQFGMYFAIWPLCDFAACFFNFKTILSKNEYILADAISFNLITIVKSIIYFIILIVKNNQSRMCLQTSMYIWLAMVIFGIATFLVQILLRARIIGMKK